MFQVRYRLRLRSRSAAGDGLEQEGELQSQHGTTLPNDAKFVSRISHGDATVGNICSRLVLILCTRECRLLCFLRLSQVATLRLHALCASSNRGHVLQSQKWASPEYEVIRLSLLRRVLVCPFRSAALRAGLLPVHQRVQRPQTMCMRALECAGRVGAEQQRPILRQ